MPETSHTAAPMETRPAPTFEKRPVDREVVLGVLREIVEVLEASGVDHLFMGGIAFVVHTEHREIEDIDVFVRPEDATRALDALAAAGFGVHETNPDWIFKATKAGVIVDVIFESKRGVRMDDEMLARGAAGTFRNLPVRAIAAEDLLVMLTAAHSEHVQGYWWDSLRLIKHCDLDWDYLQRRASIAPDRILSLLCYALSDGIAVPEGVVRALAGEVTARPVKL